MEQNADRGHHAQQSRIVNCGIVICDGNDRGIPDRSGLQQLLETVGASDLEFIQMTEPDPRYDPNGGEDKRLVDVLG